MWKLEAAGNAGIRQRQATNNSGRQLQRDQGTEGLGKEGRTRRVNNGTSEGSGRHRAPPAQVRPPLELLPSHSHFRPHPSVVCLPSLLCTPRPPLLILFDSARNPCAPVSTNNLCVLRRTMPWPSPSGAAQPLHPTCGSVCSHPLHACSTRCVSYCVPHECTPVGTEVRLLGRAVGAPAKSCIVLHTYHIHMSSVRRLRYAHATTGLGLSRRLHRINLPLVCGYRHVHHVREQPFAHPVSNLTTDCGRCTCRLTNISRCCPHRYATHAAPYTLPMCSM
jgi:hypothetical protein